MIEGERCNLCKYTGRSKCLEVAKEKLAKNANEEIANNPENTPQIILETLEKLAEVREKTKKIYCPRVPEITITDKDVPGMKGHA